LTLLAGLVALARLGRLAHHACALRRFRKHLPAGGPASLQQLVDDLAASLGLRRSVRAVVTTQEIVPMTSGWRLPLVIVPASLLDDAERLRLVLLHELIHVRRRDVLIHSVEQVMGALFVINPAVSLLRRSIRAYREMACDAEVLAQPHVSSKRYATLLYSFAAAPPTHRLLALSMASSEKHLKKRILAMKDVRSTPTHFPGTKGIAFALAGLLLGATTLIVACTDLTGPDADASALNKTEQEIFVVVEQMPELVGGLDALQGEMRYPRIARMAGISGRVIIQFTVDEEGRVVDPQVVKGLGAGCDEEALRVLQAATFKPGKQRGKPVAVKMSIPFMFKLDEEIEASVEAGPRPSMIINEFKVTSSLVTGRVLSSETQEGIAGVNILFEGSTLGATTDRDGYFKIRLLENTRQDAHLVVSHVSYQTAMLKLNSE
jgi:TonB family protein